MSRVKYIRLQDPTPHATHVVRFEIEVHASSAEQAAKFARDILLDSDSRVTADVHDIEWNDDVWEWFPEEDRGVMVYFGDRWPTHWVLGGDVKPYAGDAVAPVESVAWVRARKDD